MKTYHNKEKKFTRQFAATSLILIITLALGSNIFASAEKSLAPEDQASPFHPVFPLLDSEGENVLYTGKPVSTMNTCGACHDTQFIESHSFHSDSGLVDYNEDVQADGGRSFDSSPGLFGKWNPIQYRYLSQIADELIDLGTPEWIMTIGVRHVGGGPAVYSREGNLLRDLVVKPDDPQTNVSDPVTRIQIPWDWDQSGIVEMNCFLCHIENPDNESRIQSLHDGDFSWANTATLNNTGIVESNGDHFSWNHSAFDDKGVLKPEMITIQDPTNQNCGLCHGLVHDDVEDPLVMTGCSPDRWGTITSGQIISPQKISDSGMNLADKNTLERPWDIHAERLLDCTDCHHSLNNPLYYQESEASQPSHLLYDPRRVEIGEYLERPLHQFARGESNLSSLAPEIKNTIRNCDSCHEVEETHKWLPYTERHMQTISCEACHIPKLYSSSNQTQDWTVIHLDGSARTECRGVEGDQETIRGLITGYEPVWLSTQKSGGGSSLSPYNLITSFYWVYDDPPLPVPLAFLKTAYLENNDYHPGVKIRFDSNQDGILSDSELILDTPEKIQFIKERLNLAGLSDPRIFGDIQLYSVHHDVAGGEWVLRDCDTCHSQESRIGQQIVLASAAPTGVIPTFLNYSNISIDGQVLTGEDGVLSFQPEMFATNLYVLGRDRVSWIDKLGLLFFLGMLGGIGVHGGFRIYTAAKNRKHDMGSKQVYMYGFYERLWHWLQTFAITILIITGLVIHKPDTFSFINFRSVVIIHNIIAVILGINAFLSLFYHLSSGEIKQFIPRPRGFFDQSIAQVLYYLHGIFKGDDHPFEKTPEKKLNPLQQITYIVILNVLLPLQGITGIMIWGAQRWSGLSDALGGLTILASIHSMLAWLFATFIVLHVYLTTTGREPLSGIKAMMLGWEEIEISSESK